MAFSWGIYASPAGPLDPGQRVQTPCVPPASRFKELAAVKITIEAGDKRWWSAVALPGVPMPPSLAVSGEFDAIVTVHGTRVRAVTLASPSATVGFVVRSGRLYVAEVSPA